jgi:FkbM family methyltransferase
MDFNYTKIKIGNWLYKNCFPLYNLTYKRFKLKNDAEEIKILRSIIQPGFHVLDVGANIGFYAQILSECVGKNGVVYCYEPDAANYRHLLKNTKNLNNVRNFNMAVSDKEEVLKVYKSKLLNVDHRTYPVNNYDSVEEIKANSIDRMIENGSIQKVDLIKIDIQGYELTAFKGMQHLLKTSAHIKIVAEYWPHGFKRAGTSAIEFFDFFDAMGYQFKSLESHEQKIISRDYIVANNEQPFEFSFNVLIERK